MLMLNRAVLTAEAIKSHLHHFCNTLPKQPFVETIPHFTTQENDSHKKDQFLTARVTLPNCVGSFPRSYTASGEFLTERTAFMAAAYECYSALHKAGLVNHNFMPCIPTLQDRCRDLHPLIEVDEQIQPWRMMASAPPSSDLYKTPIHFEHKRPHGASSFCVHLITPVSVPSVSPITFKQHISITMKQICTSNTRKSTISLDELGRYKQRMVASYVPAQDQKVRLTELDFLYIFDINDSCELFSKPAMIDVAGSIMTGIFERVENFMVADLLQKSLLSTCPFRDTAHIVTAITAPSADAESNFERYEFLGDAVLKMVVSTQAFIDHASWPAGWLSQNRDNIISNARLANAALGLGLDRYILTVRPGTQACTLPRASDADVPPKKRNMSSKTPADVLQALFAAAYLDSGYALARSCIKVFVPEIRSEHSVFDMPHGAGYPRHEAEELKQLTGYRFRNITILAQALTHASCISMGSEESYQRLSYLGDAVLGFMVTQALFQHSNQLPEGQMTKIRAAIVNSNMLGYICMAHSTTRKVFDIETVTLKPVCRNERMTLWKYMRHESDELGEVQKSCNLRYDSLCGALQKQLQVGVSYPWLELAKLQPENFYSDLVKSVIAAIYVDSGQDWVACQRFLDVIGLSSYMQRMVQDDYDVAHPRSVLQQLNNLAKVQSQHESDGSFSCNVTVDGAEIATAECCRTKNEAMILAAHKAIQILHTE
jgi:dsRNA-specific ribonuclease